MKNTMARADQQREFLKKHNLMPGEAPEGQLPSKKSSSLPDMDAYKAKIAKQAQKLKLKPLREVTGDNPAIKLNPLMKFRVARLKTLKQKRMTTAKTQRTDQQSRLQKAIHDINGVDV